MSVTQTLQRGRHQYIGGTDKDAFISLGVNSSQVLLDDQNLFRIVSALQQAQAERVASGRYRFHGTLNSVSFLTNKPATWSSPQDLVASNAITDLRDDFELCLGYISDYVPVAALGPGYYERRMSLIATGEEVDMLPCGFAKNVFSEPQYNFILNGEIDITNLTASGLGAPWPVMEIMAYLRPRTPFQTVVSEITKDADVFAKDTVYGFRENDLQGTQAVLATSLVRFIRPLALSGVTDSQWSSFIYPEVVNLFRLGDIRLTPLNVELNGAYIRAWTNLNRFTATLTGEQLDSNGRIPAGIVYFGADTLEIRDISPMKYAIPRTITIPATPDNQVYLNKLGYAYEVVNSDVNTTLGFLYQPIQAIPIRVFSQFIERGNSGDTTGIPIHAVTTGDDTGDVQWRDILEPGYVEPSSGRGDNSPFINGCHYLYAPLVYLIGPDLTNRNTFQAFHTTRITLERPTFRLTRA